MIEHSRVCMYQIHFNSFLYCCMYACSVCNGFVKLCMYVCTYVCMYLNALYSYACKYAYMYIIHTLPTYTLLQRHHRHTRLIHWPTSFCCQPACMYNRWSFPPHRSRQHESNVKYWALSVRKRIAHRCALLYIHYIHTLHTYTLLQKHYSHFVVCI